MKRIVLFLLVLLLAMGCVRRTPAAPAAPSPTETPEAAAAAEAPAPGASLPAASSLLYYRFPDEYGPSGTLFSFDLDQDGVAEPLSYALRPNDEWATAITWGGSTVVVAAGDEPISAEVVDLDPASPYYNLLLTLDYGSDSPVTVELHPENGQLVQGAMVNGGYRLTGGGLQFSERSDLLGTNFGYRTYHGDALIPDSVWLDMSVPTEEELKTSLESMIDIGTVIHCAKDVPCVIDGKAATLPADTYLIPLRFMDPDVDLVMEVQTLEGTVAQPLFYDDDEEPHDPDRIYTLELEEYFDNLLFAD